MGVALAKSDIAAKADASPATRPSLLALVPLLLGVAILTLGNVSVVR